MKPKKISFQNIKDVLGRDEMKKIMAGSGEDGCYMTACWNGDTVFLWCSDCTPDTCEVTHIRPGCYA